MLLESEQRSTAEGEKSPTTKKNKRQAVEKLTKEIDSILEQEPSERKQTTRRRHKQSKPIQAAKPKEHATSAQANTPSETTCDPLEQALLVLFKPLVATLRKDLESQIADVKSHVKEIPVQNTAQTSPSVEESILLQEFITSSNKKIPLKFIAEECIGLLRSLRTYTRIFIEHENPEVREEFVKRITPALNQLYLELNALPLLDPKSAFGKIEDQREIVRTLKGKI